MDCFDQYLYNEITEAYAKTNLSSEDYEELYQRFENLNHIPEVRPYLFAMKYCGLYYDLLLFENENDSDVTHKLKESANKGYSDVYLKDRSHLGSATKKVEEFREKEPKANQNPSTPEAIRYKRMSFESCGYSGLYFTVGDIDYLAARI